MNAMRSACICPGSFDPITNGHVDVIQRAAGVFEDVVVAVMVNQSKSKRSLFELDERMELIEQACRDIPRVRIEQFSGLLVDYAGSLGIGVVVKGLRAVTDFDYELQMAQMNHRLTGLETLFLPTNPAYSYLSSSLVKEVAAYGGDVSGQVPENVRARLVDKFDKPQA